MLRTGYNMIQVNNTNYPKEYQEISSPLSVLNNVVPDTIDIISINLFQKTKTKFW
jgi:hypothetical protein